MSSTIRITSKSGVTVNEWFKRRGANLKPCLKQFLHKVVEVGRRREFQLRYINVSGYRTKRRQAELIVRNWKQAYDAAGGGARGEDKALEWAKTTYGRRKQNKYHLHEKFRSICLGQKFEGKIWTQEDYYQDYLSRYGESAVLHSAGQALDVTPVTPKIERALRKALNEGSPALFKLVGNGIIPEKCYKEVNGKRVFSPSKGAHFHVQLTPGLVSGASRYFAI